MSHLSDAPNITSDAPRAAGRSDSEPAGALGRIDLRRAVSRGAAATLVMRAGGMAFSAVATILLARELGAAAYGTYSWAVVLVLALSLPAALGADQLLVREAGVALDRGDWGRLRTLVRSALRHVAVVSAGAAALGVVIVLLIDDGSPDARGSALLVALPIIPLFALVLVAQGTLLGLGRTARALAPAMLVRQVTFTALVAAAVLAGGLSAAGAVGLQAAAAAVATVAAAVLLRRALAAQAVPPATADGDGVGPAPREWLRSSLPMGATAMLLIIEPQIGLLVLGAVSDTAETGIYAAAFQCTAPFALLLAVGRLPLGPVVARLRAAGERERLQRGLRVATRGAAAMGAVLAAILLVVPGPVLSLFGSEFTDGTAALRLLAVAMLVNLLCAFNGMVLIMAGQERAAMRTTIACFALDVVLCLALVPSLGATGAAIAVLASIVTRNVANSLATRRLLGIDSTVFGRAPASTRR